MNLLNKITLKSLKLNKRRTLVTIIGIILSVSLITAVASMFSSGMDSLIALEKREKGNFHVVLSNISSTEIDNIKNNSKVEDVFIGRDIGYSKIESSNDEKPYAYIMQYDKNSLENQIKLKEGHLPKKENEILVSSHIMSNGKVEYKIGDTISFEIGKRVSNDNKELTQKDAYNSNKLNEQVINIEKREYKIVGIIERPAFKVEPFTAPGYTFISYLDDNKLPKSVNLYIRYTKEGLNNINKTTASIIGIDETLYSNYKLNRNMDNQELKKVEDYLNNLDYQIDYNDALIMVENNGFVTQYRALFAIITIICLIIVVTSVLCIRNSFEISITEKIKQYGMLRSIGATSKQIKKNVFYESFILGIIGIPIGAILGIGANYLLILISNSIIRGTLPSGFELVYSFSFPAIVFATLLGIVTIYFSARRSAKRASKISPISSIRNSADITINAKKLKVPKIISSLFGIGGEISYKNLKRNKKKYKTTVLAIIISVILFVSLSSFVSQGFEIVKVSNGRSSVFTIVSIFSYGFIIVITLIGITNIFNTLTTSVELRKQEFAILKSVGMTTKEFNKMIRLESLFMGIKSLLYGLPIGTILSFILCKLLSRNVPIQIKFPIVQILIATIGVFIFLFIIMNYSVKKINKQNIIETIRNENI